MNKHPKHLPYSSMRYNNVSKLNLKKVDQKP